jgi:hypothetical protein
VSVWRVLAHNLHELHRPAPLRDWDDFAFPGDAVRSAVEDLQRLGLVVNLGVYGKHAIYAITALGNAYCEGRAAAVRGLRGDPLWEKYRKTNSRYRHRAKSFKRHGLKTRFIATWLNPLPARSLLSGPPSSSEQWGCALTVHRLD